jgi:signal transduction histidine kinase/HAMP domain-containing protein/ActR/RegA family two-component response regulator
MKSWLSSRLQTKLVFAFLLVLVLPVTIVAGYSLLRARTMLLAQSQSEQQRLVEAHAALVESKLLQGSSDLLLLARSPALRTQPSSPEGLAPLRLGEISRLFQAYLQRSTGRYRCICLINVDGREQVCVERRDDVFVRIPSAELRDRIDDPIFTHAMSLRGIPAAQPVTIAPVSPASPRSTMIEPTIAYATSLQDPIGDFSGVLVIEALADPIFALADSGARDVETYVIDSSGHYLVHPDPANRFGDWAGSGVSLYTEQPQTADDILREASGALVNSSDRPGFVQVFSRVRPQGQAAIQWTILYSQPIDALLWELPEIQAVVVTITLTAMLIAMLVALQVSRGIVRPVRELSAAAERVGSGDLHTPIPVAGRDEIGALGRTLQWTVTYLRETIDRAERRRSEAETLRTATMALNSTLDLSHVLDMILQELHKVVPFDSASVQQYHDGCTTIIGVYGLRKGEEMIGLTFDVSIAGTPNYEIVSRCETLVLADAPEAYPHFKEWPYINDPIRSWLGVPLIFGERLIGLITLDKFEPGFFSAEHARLAQAFASQAALALENARLYEAAQAEIGERRRAEAELREREQFLQSIYDASGEAIWVVEQTSDGNYVVVMTNQQDPARPAYFDRGAVGRLIEQIWGPRYGGAMCRQYDHCLQAGHPLSYEETLPFIDGERTFLTSLSPLPDHQGRTRLLGMSADVTDLHQLKGQLLHSQRMEALGRLAGGLAHDFNNMLTVILGECELMAGDLPPDSSLSEPLNQIREAGNRTAVLTRQLLAFSRRQVLRPEILNLNQVVTAMQRMLRRLIGEDITLETRLNPQIGTVRADASQIEQVVMNLAINARDAMPAGGLLCIETEPVRLHTTLHTIFSEIPPGAYVLLAISDTGGGMDHETITHAFEPFYTTKPRGQGTGLGLATVHGIVQQSAGYIDCASVAGHGTRFEVYLPETAESIDVQAPPDVRHEARTGRERILLAEDDERLRGLVRRMLTRQGYEVLAAEHGVAAEALVADPALPIDLLLTDIIMPGGLDGVQLAKRLRVARPHLKIIYMSGYTDDVLVDRSLMVDDAQFMAKPFTPNALLNKVREVLDTDVRTLSDA